AAALFGYPALGLREVVGMGRRLAALAVSRFRQFPRAVGGLAYLAQVAGGRAAPESSAQRRGQALRWHRRSRSRRRRDRVRSTHAVRQDRRDAILARQLTRTCARILKDVPGSVG